MQDRQVQSECGQNDSNINVLRIAVGYLAEKSLPMKKVNEESIDVEDQKPENPDCRDKQGGGKNHSPAAKLSGKQNPGEKVSNPKDSNASHIGFEHARFRNLVRSASP
jgi:hypothetical protein